MVKKTDSDNDQHFQSGQKVDNSKRKIQQDYEFTLVKERISWGIPC